VLVKNKAIFFFNFFGLAKTLSYRPVPFERDADGTPLTNFLKGGKNNNNKLFYCVEHNIE
jgi:hypothetical protein